MLTQLKISNELKGLDKIDVINRQLSILFNHLKHGSALHIEFKGSILQVTLVTWCGEIFARAILIDDFITMTEEEIKEFVSEYF